MGQTTPPYGMALFVMKAVAPPDTTMGDCIRAAMPFLGCDLVALILILIFPAIALWLPSMMSM
jgi:TRAP-type mannitol/chloroaromatic compound transport system permease large subunit